ncbi:MAG: AmmeMemoRadiSam system protein B [Planctomycetota bacterium]|nr:MAG: AmmeMemoRadiSam system protein B [Planctomycetota bacterium]
MSEQGQTSGNPGEQAPPYDASLPHHLHAKLRRVRGFPIPAQTPDGKQQMLLGLADAQQISERMVATVPAAQQILPLLDGQHTPEEIAAKIGKGLSSEFVENLIAQLDHAGLLHGPVFDAMLAKMREDFDSLDHLPPGSTAQVAEALAAQSLGQDADEKARLEAAPDKLREAMDQWIDQALAKAENPSFDRLPRAIVAPHIDYPRGWINYGAIWGRLRVCDRPDRVVILGTNHFGQATGVAGCDKGYETPLGLCPLDRALVDVLCAKLGEEDSAKLFEHRFDHEREHSIELQIPWVQHCLGKDDAGNYCPVFGVLVHDPAINNGESYDGRGLGLEPFVAAMKQALAELGGRTLVVSSADLSHVGPAFGDQRKLAGDDEEAVAFRNKVAAHDREMLKYVTENRPGDLVSSMAWQQNPTRWCSTGSLVATLQIVEPTKVELLSYAAAMDQQGASMVSQAALAME